MPAFWIEGRLSTGISLGSFLNPSSRETVKGGKPSELKRVQKLLAGSAARVRVESVPLYFYFSESFFFFFNYSFFKFLKCLCLSIHSICILGPHDTTIPPPQPSKFKDIMTSFIAPIMPLPSIVPDLLNHLHYSRSVFFFFFHLKISLEKLTSSMW